MFPTSLVACLFQVWRLAIHKHKFEINGGCVITVIPVPIVSQGVSFFSKWFFFYSCHPETYPTLQCTISTYLAQCRHALKGSCLQWELWPMTCWNFFDRLDIVKKKLNLLNEVFRNYRSGCEMPHLLSEATVGCCG